MPDSAAELIDRFSVFAANLLHEMRDRKLSQLPYKQMKVVRHQAVSEDLELLPNVEPPDK